MSYMITGCVRMQCVLVKVGDQIIQLFNIHNNFFQSKFKLVIFHIKSNVFATRSKVSLQSYIYRKIINFALL